MTRPLRSRCPWCGHFHALASAVSLRSDAVAEEPVAAEGDLSICMGCGEVSVFAFAQPGRLRFPTRAEVDRFPFNPALLTATLAWNDALPDGPHKRPVLHRPDWMEVT